MFKHLFDVQRVTPQWGKDTLSMELRIQGSRVIWCNLKLHRNPFMKVTTVVPTTFFDLAPSSDGVRSHDGLIFDTAWQVAEKAYSLASWNDKTHSDAAWELLKSRESTIALDALVDTSIWRTKIGTAIPVLLPGPPSQQGVLYHDSIWSNDDQLTLETLKNLAKLHELAGDDLRRLSPYEQRLLLGDVNPTMLPPTARPALASSVKNEVWRRDQGRCVQCRTNERLEFDHIIPYSKGGADTVRNLQLLCQECNRKKQATI